MPTKHISSRNDHHQKKPLRKDGCSGCLKIESANMKPEFDPLRAACKIFAFPPPDFTVSNASVQIADLSLKVTFQLLGC